MKRRVVEGEVHHIYQKTVDGILMFYSAMDYLVFFTIVCTMAERQGITILALCPMPDHLHNASRVRSEVQFTKFTQAYTQIFAREWNTSRKRKGSLFHERFGSAVKLGNKAVRSTLNYNNNNPVERKITKLAEDYRWNFLRYAISKNPYSEPIVESKASQKLRRALREARAIHRKDGWVRYATLDRWMKGLSAGEMQQLADYIITTWNVIDYSDAISYYGNYDAMIRSLHDNTGGEYDIKEDRDKYTDAVYKDCTKILLMEKAINNVREIPMLPVEKKMELYRLLSIRTPANKKQLRKYLHLTFDITECSHDIPTRRHIPQKSSGG